MRVRLDAARRGGALPGVFTPDDVVVHRQHVQAAVPALQVYSPPCVIRAVGDPAALRRGLGRSPQLRIYREYVDALGLGYAVSAQRSLTMPGYDGSIEMRYARARR